MKAAFRDSFVEYVEFMGITENYPRWFQKEIEKAIIMDDNRFTFWVPHNERSMDYYEKQLIEDYSVFIKKGNEIHLTDYGTFHSLYTVFKYNRYNNRGVASFSEDCIDYIECRPGYLVGNYPNWFYEYFTEKVNFPYNEETILFQEDNEVSVTEHYVFLRNRFGEIKGMEYSDFIKYYNPNPKIGG